MLRAGPFLDGLCVSTVVVRYEVESVYIIITLAKSEIDSPGMDRLTEKAIVFAFLRYNIIFIPSHQRLTNNQSIKKSALSFLEVVQYCTVHCTGTLFVFSSYSLFIRDITELVMASLPTNFET